MRIRFTKDSIYETGGPGVGPKFAKGFVLDSADVAAALGMAEASAAYSEAFLSRWVQRNVAEEVDRRAHTDAERKAADPQPESKPAPASKEPEPQPEPIKGAHPVPRAAVQQPLGTAKRGELTKGADKP